MTEDRSTYIDQDIEIAHVVYVTVRVRTMRMNHVSGAQCRNFATAKFVKMLEYGILATRGIKCTQHAPLDLVLKQMADPCYRAPKSESP